MKTMYRKKLDAVRLHISRFLHSSLTEYVKLTANNLVSDFDEMEAEGCDVVDPDPQFQTEIEELLWEQMAVIAENNVIAHEHGGRQQ